MFFPGLVLYPLSDLPALTLLILSASALVAAFGVQNNRLRIILLILSGLLAHGTYNTRTICIFSAVLLLIGLVAFLAKQAGFGRLRMAGWFVLGAFLACVPQIAFNHKAHSQLSPLVIANTSATHSLFASQLLWGITLQKYETTIDPASPSPALFYLDPAGERFFGEVELDGATFGVGEYLDLLLDYPLAFVGIFGRHFINGLDVRDGEVYRDVGSAHQTWTAFANFCVVFLGSMLLFIQIVRHPPNSRFEAWFWLFCVLAPVLAVVPSAVETRFFLPLHVTLYSAIAFSTGGLGTTVRQQWAFYVIMFVLCLSLFYGVTQTTLAGLQYKYPVIYRGY